MPYFNPNFYPPPTTTKKKCFILQSSSTQVELQYHSDSLEMTAFS